MSVLPQVDPGVEGLPLPLLAPLVVFRLEAGSVSIGQHQTALHAFVYFRGLQPLLGALLPMHYCKQFPQRFLSDIAP